MKGGGITRVLIVKDKLSGKSKGYGYVELRDEPMLRDVMGALQNVGAIELDNSNRQAK